MSLYSLVSSRLWMPSFLATIEEFFDIAIIIAVVLFIVGLIAIIVYEYESRRG